MRKKKRKKDKNLQLAKFVQFMNSGFTRVEIIELMGLQPAEFESLFGIFYDQIERDVTDKTTIRLYAEFCARKYQLIRDLEGLKVALSSNNWKNGQAYVQAAKAQSDMLDSMIKVGQDLLIVDKRPQEMFLLDGRDPREVDADDLEEAAFEEIRKAEAAIGGSRRKGGGKVIALYSKKD